MPEEANEKPDIRKRVVEDRGFLKKLQLAIPGFRGYRKREDRRAADGLLRKQLADRIQEVRKVADEIRIALAKNMELEMLDDAGALINMLDTVEAKVRHADQGYSGISADVKIMEGEIEKLYEYDYSLIERVENIRKRVDRAYEMALFGDFDGLRSELEGLKRDLREFNALFSRRIEYATETGVL
jgi:SMC interacting uncharacterized protein involved in chromosome segregation